MSRYYHRLLAILLISLFPLSVIFGYSGIPKKEKTQPKGTFYFSWGYNKDWFSKSDLHFYNPVNNSYDFTLFDVKAVDRPGYKQILGTDLSIPQYVYRFGYYLDKYHVGFEINFDHTKYVMVQDQVAHLKGRIKDTYYDQDTVLSRNFLQFEHTNGANFLMLNIIKRARISESPNKKFASWAIVKVGGGMVIPKTDVTLFGERLDNCFHIAGYIFGIEGGFRLEMFKYIFLEPTIKGSFANYKSVLTVSEGKAHHHFWTFETILSGGFQVRF